MSKHVKKCKTIQQKQKYIIKKIEINNNDNKNINVFANFEFIENFDKFLFVSL